MSSTEFETLYSQYLEHGNMIGFENWLEINNSKNRNTMDIENLVKISTYAQSIGKSNELVRLWIRKGKWENGKQYVNIDGVIFVNLNNVK